MSCLITSELACGNIFIRPSAVMKAGDVVHGHKHKFDHTTIVFTGAIKVKAKLEDGTEIEREFQSPRPDAIKGSHVLIKAGVEHEITALENNTIFWCIYAHRSPQGEVWQNYTGWGEAYI